MRANLKFGQEKRGTYQWTIQFGDLKSEVHKGSEFKMSKEEIRSRESCIYGDHTFEDSPPATKKAKYQPRQPGRRSPVTCITTEDFFFITLCWHSLVPSKNGERERDPGNICEKSCRLPVHHHLCIVLTPDPTLSRGEMVWWAKSNFLG